MSSRQKISISKLKLATPLLFLLPWTLYFGIIFARAIVIHPDGVLHAGPATLWGDWCAHFVMGSAMAYRKLILTASPFLYGAPFNYPFLANLVSALLIRMGVPFFKAFTIPSFIMTTVLVACLYGFYRSVFRSDKTASLSTMIFLCNGGLGFFYTLQKAWETRHFFHTLLFNPAVSTVGDDPLIKWHSVISSILIPQRSFQFGFPMALIALILIHPFRRTWTIPSWKSVIVSALLLGCLPIAHTHSFAAALILTPLWAMGSIMTSDARDRRTTFVRWVTFFLLMGTVSGSLITFFYPDRAMARSFIEFYPGWLARENVFSWLKFWLLNWGITPFLAISGFALWFRRKDLQQRLRCLYFTAPFPILFLLMNLFKFQPWDWDNTKILVWISLGVSGWAGFLISKGLTRWNLKISALSTMVFLVAILSGGWDAYRHLIFPLNTFGLYNQTDLKLAEWTRSHTDPNSVWLTGYQHNNWVNNLTGRKVIMVYDGWLWSHGYTYHQQQQDLSTMMTQPDRKDLFEKYDISYAAIGPAEVDSLKADMKKFEALFPVAHQMDATKIFICKPPKNYSTESKTNQ